ASSGRKLESRGSNRYHDTGTGEDYVCGFDSDRFLPSPERHGAVAHPGAVPHVESFFFARFWADRPDHAYLSNDCFPTATAGGTLHRPAAAALFSGDRKWTYVCRVAGFGSR